MTVDEGEPSETRLWTAKLSSIVCNVDAIQFETGDGRPDRHRTGGDDELVIPQLLDGAVRAHRGD